MRSETESLPYKFHGTVVKGFGRGGKQLGCPTANVDDKTVQNLPEKLAFGVYYGFAAVHNQVYTMVMSVGKNPQFNNEMKTAEVHFIGYEGPDFYGSTIQVVIVDFIRPMEVYKSLDDLKNAIRDDIDIAVQKTKDNKNIRLRSDLFSSL